MKNVFESAYRELDDAGELYECDGGCAGDGGGISGGDMTTGTPAGPDGGITSDSVLGPSGKFEKGEGCLGKGDFHVPFPIMPTLFRYGKDCCNGGGSAKKRKGKDGKTVSAKNPYAKGAKTVIAEADAFPYEGDAPREFNNVIAPYQVDRIYNDVLYYNDKYRLAWLLKKDGVLHMYKPFDTGSFWTVYATHLTQDGLVQMDYKAGKYSTEKEALDAVYKAADAHRKALEEHLASLTEAEEFEKIDDIVGFLASADLEWTEATKFQRLAARKSEGGEKVTTVGSDGNTETERVTKPGDWIVNNASNPDNVWIMDGKTFEKKYEPDGKAGVYRPKDGPMLAAPISGCCRSGVEFAPPMWGGDTIKVRNDGWFMRDPSNEKDVYAISKADFESTYRLKGVNEGISPRDIMNWEAHGRDPRYFPRDRGRDVNVRALVAELKQKFHGQFADVRLQNLGGTWKVEFAVEGLDKPLKGQRLVKTAVPRVDDVIRLLRIRGVETNQYDVTAVPAGKPLAENDVEYTDTGLPYLPSAKAGMLAESAAPVVSDQTIDAFTAKYYCMFADRDFQQRVEEIKNSPEYRKMADGMIKNQLARAKSVGQERIDEFVLPAAALAYPALVPAVKIVGGMVMAWLASKLATDAVVSATKDIGSAAASAAAQTVAETPVIELDPVTVEATRLPPDGEGGGFWKKFLGTAFGSALTAAGVFLANLFGLGTAAAETITIGLASAIACGCAALARHMLPVMVSWFRKLRETGVIAAVEFESNGDRYRMSYSVRDGKWRMYLLGSRIFSRRANPTPQEAQQAMNTDFFRKFRERCSETLHRYLEDPVNAAVLATLALQNEKDPDMKYAKDVLSKKDEFLARFDSPTFVTETGK